MIDYINSLKDKRRATLATLLKEGKTYRSRQVAFQHGYLNALMDIQAALNQPQREREIREALDILKDREG